MQVECTEVESENHLEANDAHQIDPHLRFCQSVTPAASSFNASNPSASFRIAGRQSRSGRDPYDTRMCPGAPKALKRSQREVTNRQHAGGSALIRSFSKHVEPHRSTDEWEGREDTP